MTLLPPSAARRTITAGFCAAVWFVAACGTQDAAPVPPGGAPTPGQRPSLASFADAGFGAGVGVAIAPVGGGRVILLGDQTPREAWSTIKVPLSIAALRSGADQELVERAVVDSDNDAAMDLWHALGTSEEARQQVRSVLRDGGDTATTISTAVDDEGQGTFGLTLWPLADAARFTSRLPCLADSAPVIDYMGRVADSQQWGMYSVPTPSGVPTVRTAVKGGWGDEDEVRQIALITFPDGSQTAVAATSFRAGQSIEDGIAVLNGIGRWIGRNLGALPRGRC